jgi:hypothetical protein
MNRTIPFLFRQVGTNTPTLEFRHAVDQNYPPVSVVRGGVGAYTLVVDGVTDYSKVELHFSPMWVEEQGNGDRVYPQHQNQGYLLLVGRGPVGQLDFDMAADVYIPMEIRLY